MGCYMFPGNLWNIIEVKTMSFYYAQINEEHICTGVSELAIDMSDHKNLIQINYMDVALLNKKWNGMGWEEVSLQPPEPPMT